MGIVSRCVSYKDFLDLFDGFSVAVKQRLYKPLPYQMYKTFQKEILNLSPGDVIIDYDPHDHAMFVPTDWQNHLFTVDGESFGAYLYDVLGIENSLWVYEGREDPFYYYCDRKLSLTEKKVNKAVDNNTAKNNEEDNKMKFNFDFGPVDANKVRMSMYGVAIKNIDGVWVSYDSNGNQVMDVDVFNFDGSQFMYKMPVAIKDIKTGDVVVHAKKPMFVTGISNGSIQAVDVYEGEVKNIIPTTNMFGFNFVTKVVSLINMGTPSAEAPFGNMWPLMLLSDGKMNKDNMLMLALMNGGVNSGMDMFSNPLMMMALMDSDKDNTMMLAMLAMQNQNKVCNCGGSCQAPIQE